MESSGFAAHAKGFVQPDADSGDVFLTVFRQKFSFLFFSPETITTTLSNLPVLPSPALQTNQYKA